jgi:putative addiction module killer protein
MHKSKEIYFYADNNGKCLVKLWLNKLEVQTRSRILNRIMRLEHGHYGDFKHIEGGIFELRFFFGKGYRVYFIEDGEKIILLLNAGDKDSQQRDIKLAKSLLNNYLNTQRGNNGKI